MESGFVSLTDMYPSLQLDIRYAGHQNLTGAPLAGYHAANELLTCQAAEELGKALRILAAQGLGLLVYDAYRPQKAVESFVRWSLQPEDGRTKEAFYPHLDKKDLFPQGYIAQRSGHSRGSTVDLTLTDTDGIPLEMGSTFDLMDERSHHGYAALPAQVLRRRRLLRETMEQAGFLAYENEWWHYRLANEPYPDTYFDFDIEE